MKTCNLLFVLFVGLFVQFNASSAIAADNNHKHKQNRESRQSVSDPADTTKLSSTTERSTVSDSQASSANHDGVPNTAGTQPSGESQVSRAADGPQSTGEGFFNDKMKTLILISTGILLGFLAVVLSIFIYFKANIRFKRIEEGLQETGNNVKRIENNSLNPLAALRSNVSELEAMNKDFSTKLKAIESTLRTSAIRTEERVIDSERANDQAVPIDKTLRTGNERSASTRRFAQYADKGDGFSLDRISESPEGDKIFEIIFIGNNGKFSVVVNKNVQKLALTNIDYFLNKTCTYDTFPGPNSTIITDEPGELRLQGDKWQVIKPAKIRFS